MHGILKLGCASAIFLTNMGSAVITFYVIRMAMAHWASAAISASNCTIAGIFFGIVFLLQLPEIAPAEAAIVANHKFNSPVPIGGSSLFAGILLVYSIEMVARWYSQRHNMTMHGHSHDMPLVPRVADNENNVREDDNSPVVKVPTIVKYGIFALLMSIHSFTEGIPLGYKKNRDEVLAFFWPLIIHKVLEAISVACAGQHERPHLAFIGSTIHASMTPLGALAGYVMGSLESSLGADILMVFLMGSSTGVLLYILFVEVFVPEIANAATSNGIKLVCLVIGFGITLATTVIIHLLESDL